jgi:hypothetical protein
LPNKEKNYSEIKCFMFVLPNGSGIEYAACNRWKGIYGIGRKHEEMGRYKSRRS